MFRKRVKTKLQISLERAGVDLSGSLGNTLIEALIGHGLSDYSLIGKRIETEDIDNNYYNFWVEDSSLWVGSIKLGVSGQCQISTRSADSANRDEHPPKWDNTRIYSRYDPLYDLFRKPLNDV